MFRSQTQDAVLVVRRQEVVGADEHEHLILSGLSLNIFGCFSDLKAQCVINNQHVLAGVGPKFLFWWSKHSLHHICQPDSTQVDSAQSGRGLHFPYNNTTCVKVCL